MQHCRRGGGIVGAILEAERSYVLRLPLVDSLPSMLAHWSLAKESKPNDSCTRALQDRIAHGYEGWAKHDADQQIIYALIKPLRPQAKVPTTKPVVRATGQFSSEEGP